MLTTFFLIVSSFFAPQLELIDINDKGLEKVLTTFIDSIDSSNNFSEVKYCILIKVQGSKAKRIVYLGAVGSIEDFKMHGIPDAYSIFDNKLVFWYKSSGTGMISYEDFKEQFTHAGKEKFWTQDKIYAFDGRPFRYVFEKLELIHTRRVCRFPSKVFYTAGYRFDDKGNLMFADGSYDLCNILEFSPEFEPYKFELNEYFDKLDVKVDSLSDLTVTMVIGKNGKVQSVEIEDKNSRINETKKKEYKKIIKEMPAWNKAKLGKRRVAYKLVVSLW